MRSVAGPSSDGTIGVVDGLRLVDCLRRVALAAVCTAVEPRRAYHKRKFTEATRFVDRLRLGQTERGSFVLTVLSSVTPALTEDPSRQEPDPFERKVTRTLALALSGLEAAALQGSLENQIMTHRHGGARPIAERDRESCLIDLVRPCAAGGSWDARIV